MMIEDTQQMKMKVKMKRFRGWMRISDVRPPYQVEYSSQTPKLLSVSRASYTPGIAMMIKNTNLYILIPVSMALTSFKITVKREI